MTLLEFQEFVRNICAYYERRIPNDHTLDLWYDRVRNIPYESVEWIKGRIFEQDTFPKNYPVAIWQLYQAWLEAHPEKRAPDRTQYSCPDCESGWLVLEKQLPQYSIPISYSAPCARCKQVKAANYMSLDDAVRNGYRRKDLVSEHTVQRQPIRELIESIGRPVPDPAAM